MAKAIRLRDPADRVLVLLLHWCSIPIPVPLPGNDSNEELVNLVKNICDPSRKLVIDAQMVGYTQHTI